MSTVELPETRSRVAPRGLNSVKRKTRGDDQEGTTTRAGGSGGSGGSAGIVIGDLSDQARRSYLNYALSVITARALPDVRDGLKPVQRRILYTMYADLHLYHDARHRKSAKVVGDVIGKYHPHGDTAVYDAMVRMAQDFAMRARLVDGQGNFGSIDGDRAAAYRYTEARLTKVAGEILKELGSDTVDFQPNYDGTGKEPQVLPSRYPNLLVNGATGIAVGMATSIPPHNLREVIKACLTMIDDPKASVRKLLRNIKGPDFPTGGQLVAERDALVKAYETGRGTLKLRGSWKVESVPKSTKSVLVITEVPYAVEKGTLVEEIGNLVAARKLPGVQGISDLSTEDIRVELELTGNANPELIMAYLFKHTRMQVSVKFDLTCLVPLTATALTKSDDGEDPGLCGPARLPLDAILRHFLDFRFGTVRRRFEYELRKLEARIHILEGFEKIFDDLDRAIRIIRKSDGKADAAVKLMKAFDLDEIQADAILETKLYKLAKLEIEKIREELEDKRKRAAKIRAILNSKKKLWAVVREELEAVAEEYGDRRRTQIDAEDLTEEYNAESFIPDEDTFALVTRDGWVKRQRVLNLETTRMREGDAPLVVVGGSTRKCLIAFSNQGSAYVTRLNDVPASSGHGTPVQKLFKFKDGERVIAAAGTDERVMPEFAREKPVLGEEYEEPYPHFIAVTKKGMALRFTLWPHREVSTARGRLFGRTKPEDEFISVFKVYAEDDLVVITRRGRVLSCNVMDINLLAGPGRGVALIKLDADDEVLGATTASVPLMLHKSSGASQKLAAGSVEVGNRAGKGKALIKRGSIKSIEFPAPEVPVFDPEEASAKPSKSRKR